jgi:hypothetical protein
MNLQRREALKAGGGLGLFGLNPLHLLAICGCVLAAGLLSATLPLLTNMRRNPITDMRDDS